MMTIQELDEELEITPAVEGLHFPAGKRQILAQAHLNGANGDVLDALEGLENRQFSGVADVLAEVSRVYSRN